MVAVQEILDTAAAANAVSLGTGVVTENFREAVKNYIKVNVILLPAERRLISKYVPFSIMFTDTYAVPHDHAAIAALRQLSRDVYERAFKIANTSERTLVVGSSAREISLYNNNPNIHHYVYGGENKDVDRIIRPALIAIADKLKKKASKADRRVYLPNEADKMAGAPRKVAKRYNNMVEILRDYQTVHKLPETIHTDPVPVNTLVFEDSIYNFDPVSLVKLFQETGANVAYGYAMLPMELLFPDMPANRLYEFYSDGEYASLTFRRGNSNGYRHRVAAWGTLLKNPVIVSRGFHLVVEIVTRMGPMAVFKLVRATRREPVVRTIGLTDAEAYVRLLDMEAMYDVKTDKLMSPLKYVSVHESEFYDALNYMCALDKKSITYTNCMAFVRRRMGGMSLVSKELVAPWELPRKLQHTFCLTVVAYSKLLTGTMGRYADLEGLFMETWWESVKTRVARWFQITIREKSDILYALLYKHNLTEDLVKFPPISVYQEGYVRRVYDINVIKKNGHPWRDGQDSMDQTDSDNTATDRLSGQAGLYLDFQNEEEMPSCPTCLGVHGRMGAQKMVCTPKAATSHNFSLTDAQIGAMKASLMDSDGDPQGIREVKERALKHLPRLPFSRKAKVHYINAGPGCGKSYFIRQMADERDLVVAPFSKLKPDYENLKRADGSLYNLTFKTTHRAMEVRNHSRIFVDEFTSFPYEFLACIVFLNAAEEVYLVGDDKQSRIREPDEGLYIGNRVDLDQTPTHTLTVNFRNPPDTVALLNKLFGYQMRAFKDHVSEPSIVFKSISETQSTETALRMCFSGKGAESVTENENNTVRSNQGGTSERVALYVTSLDKNIPEESTLQTVALSRHTKTLTVYLDDSSVAGKFRSLIDQGEGWTMEYTKYLTFGGTPELDIERSDPVITEILSDPDSDNRDSSDSEGTWDLKGLFRRKQKPKITYPDTSDDENLVGTPAPQSGEGSKADENTKKEGMKGKETSKDTTGLGIGVYSKGSNAELGCNQDAFGVLREFAGSQKTLSEDGFWDDKAKAVWPEMFPPKTWRVRSDGEKIPPCIRVRGPCFATGRMKVQTVPGDGSCFYHSLAVVANLGDDEAKPEVMKRKLLKSEWLNDFLDADNIRRTLDPDERIWASHDVVTLAAWEYNINICIHATDPAISVGYFAMSRNAGAKVGHIRWSGAHFDPYVPRDVDSGVGSAESLVSLVMSDATLSSWLGTGRSGSTKSEVISSGSEVECPQKVKECVVSLSWEDQAAVSDSDASVDWGGSKIPECDSGVETCQDTREKTFPTLKKALADQIPKMCDCDRKRDFPGLTDGDRGVAPNTMDKIDQLMGKFRTEGGVLAVLGGAPRKGAKTAPMLTETVRDRFDKVWTVDPRFCASLGKDGQLRACSFEEVSFVGVHSFFSDMYMVPAQRDSSGRMWNNNGLDRVLEKYKRENPVETWADFEIVHKLTWSTTNFPMLAECVSQAREVLFLRVNASGACSEWFVYMQDLQKPVVRDCCDIGMRVHALWGHAEACQNCKLGRVEPGLTVFRKPTRYPSVQTNCSAEKGALYKRALTTFRLRGRIHNVPMAAVARLRDRDRTELMFRKLVGLPAVPVVSGGGAIAHAQAIGRADAEKKRKTQKVEPRSHREGQVTGYAPEVESRTNGEDYIIRKVEDDGRAYMAEHTDFSDAMQTWVSDTRLGTRLVERMPMLPPLVVKPLRPTFDAYLQMAEMLASSAGAEDVTSWNDFASQVVRGNFGTGRFNADQIFYPTNQRKHPVKMLEEFRSMGPGVGLHYSAKRPCQTLAVLETRYLNLREIYPFGHKEREMAKEIVSLWWDEHARPVYNRPAVFTEDEIDQAYRALLTDARAKGYAERFDSLGGWDSAEGRKVRFHLKSIFKPKVNCDVYKVGQGISAWSVQSLAMFCSVFRLLTGVTIRTDKDYVVTDAYWSEREFIDYLNDQFDTVPDVAPFGVTDGEMFDACQNAFTQEIEKEYLRRVGLSEEIIDLYYSFRAGYLIVSSVAVGVAGTQKTSGEPGTLYNNGVVSKTISNWLLRGLGPQVIIYKGDDFVKRQCGLALDTTRKARLDAACGLRIRVNISKGADFCGLILEDGAIFPSVIRKANKCVAHRFRSYEHFTEYQESLRDWVKTVESFSAEEVIAHNASLYGMPVGQVDALYDGIKSMSHINQSQFLNCTRLQMEVAGIPQMCSQTHTPIMFS